MSVLHGARVPISSRDSMHLLNAIHRKLSPKRGVLQELACHSLQPKSGLTTVFVWLKS